MAYLIAEIGQNHDGSLEKAKKLVDLVSTPVKDEYFDLECSPFDAVKTTIRDLDCEMSNEMWESEYNSKHSYGETYGKHRIMLELSNDEILQLSEYAEINAIDFILGVSNPGKRLDYLMKNMDWLKALKIPSRDINNFPLLEAVAVHAAARKIPVILSTGFCTDGYDKLGKAMKTLVKEVDVTNISILHCVSQYPTEYQNVGLGEIIRLRQAVPACMIGYSDHTVGISTGVAAAALGAKMIEKHVTLDRHGRGGDHYCSLGPDGITRFIRDIRNLEASLLFNEHKHLPQDRIERVGRSLAYATDLPKGHKITEDDFIMASPGGHLEWEDRMKLVGKLLKQEVAKNDTVRLEHAKERTNAPREKKTYNI